MIRGLIKLLGVVFAGQALAIFFGKKDVRKKVEQATGFEKVQIMMDELITLNKEVLVGMGVEKKTLDDGQKKAMETIEEYVDKAKDSVEEMKTAAHNKYDEIAAKADTMLMKAKDEASKYLSEDQLNKVQDTIYIIQGHISDLKKNKDKSDK